MKSKFLILTISILAVVMLFVGCGRNDGNAGNTTSTTRSTTTSSTTNNTTEG